MNGNERFIFGKIPILSKTKLTEIGFADVITDNATGKHYSQYELLKICDLLNLLDAGCDGQIKRRDEKWYKVEQVYEKELKKLREKNIQLERENSLLEFKIGEKEENIITDFINYLADIEIDSETKRKLKNMMEDYLELI